jgi:hypothetical protein
MLRIMSYFCKDFNSDTIFTNLSNDKNAYACYIQLAVAIIYGLWLLFSNIIACPPIASSWNKSLFGSGISGRPLRFSDTPISIIINLAILSAPMPVIKQLSLPRKQKIGFYFIFSLGFCMMSTSCSSWNIRNSLLTVNFL